MKRNNNMGTSPSHHTFLNPTAADRLYEDDESLAADLLGVASWFFVLADRSESKHPVPIVDLSWDEHVDDESGDAYFYNSITDVSQWAPPPCAPGAPGQNNLSEGRRALIVRAMFPCRGVGVAQ